MKNIARRFQMKGGEFCVLRSPEARDAAQRVAFLRQVNGETPFMGRGSQDSPSDVDMVAEILQDQLEDDRTLEIAAFVGDEMIASGGISPVARAYPRKAHRASIGLCVKKERWGQGLGRRLIEELTKAAVRMGYTQIELTVAANNTRAINLYEKCGFKEAGRMPNALKYEDGHTSDELSMVKII